MGSKRPFRLTVRTAPSHGVNTGSIPVGVMQVHKNQWYNEAHVRWVASFTPAQAVV